MGRFVALVLQEGRNRDIPGLFHKSLRRPESALDRVTFWRRGTVYGRHGQREGAFRHADAFYGQKGGDCDVLGLRVGKAVVLSGEDDQPAGDILGVFAGRNHAGQIVQGSVRVRVPHGFDIGADEVIMIVSALVEPHDPGLGTFHDDVCRDVNGSGRVRVGGQGGQFYGVQRLPGVPVYNRGKIVHGLRVHVDIHVAEAPDGVGECSADDLQNVVFGQRLQFKDAGTGQQSAVDLEIGIFRCCADQRDDSLFYIRQQVILLGLVEPVDFINEQDCSPVFGLAEFDGLVDDFFHVGLARVGGVDGTEDRVGGVGDDGGDAGFSGSGRAI